MFFVVHSSEWKTVAVPESCKVFTATARTEYALAGKWTRSPYGAEVGMRCCVALRFSASTVAASPFSQ
jgi:hypothetical protein